jgi:hypothetical protein
MTNSYDLPIPGEEIVKKKRKRSSGGASRLNVHSPLDPHTGNSTLCSLVDPRSPHLSGWIAECHKCGKIGKFRHVFEGRPFQHSTGDGKYCGYFRLNPRKMGTVMLTQAPSVVSEAIQPVESLPSVDDSSVVVLDPSVALVETVVATLPTTSTDYGTTMA